jgi:GT2 family glycosyltransferase
VIGFGCVIGDEGQYRRWALPGIETIAEEDTVIAVRRDQDCIFAAYNDILDELGAREDLEAVVLLHQDLEIADPGFMAKLRAALASGNVAIAGVIGGCGTGGKPWWQCERIVGSFGWDWLMDPAREAIFDPATFWVEYGMREGPVDVVDGCLIALSGWAARSLRFDEALAPGFHGYDIDICMQARSNGYGVRVADLHIVHHNDAALPDAVEFAEACVAVRRKWGEPADVAKVTELAF